MKKKVFRERRNVLEEQTNTNSVIDADKEKVSKKGFKRANKKEDK